MARDYGIDLSESSIGHILTEFMTRGLILRYAAAIRRAPARRFIGHAQRKDHEMRPQATGDLTQADSSSVFVAEFERVCKDK